MPAIPLDTGRVALTLEKIEENRGKSRFGPWLLSPYDVFLQSRDPCRIQTNHSSAHLRLPRERLTVSFATSIRDNVVARLICAYGQRACTEPSRGLLGVVHGPPSRHHRRQKAWQVGSAGARRGYSAYRTCNGTALPTLAQRVRAARHSEAHPRHQSNAEVRREGSWP